MINPSNIIIDQQVESLHLNCVSTVDSLNVMICTILSSDGQMIDQAVDIMMDQRSTSWWSTVDIMMINGRHHEDQQSTSWRSTVDIMMINGRHHEEQRSTSWWSTVDIMMINGRHHEDQQSTSWRSTVDITMINDEDHSGDFFFC